MKTKDFYFDHTYNVDQGHKFLKRLSKMGFILERQTVEHPGKAFCRFIKLESDNQRGVSYLEFVDQRIKNYKIKNPGISFGYSYKLESLFKILKNRLNCTLTHKNYEWKRDDKNKLPGWNFLNFQNTNIRAYTPWLTEYEPHPKRNRVAKAPKHINTVYKLLKIEIEINHNGQKFYNKLFSINSTHPIELACGTDLKFKNSKSNSYNRVILACKDLEKFFEVARGAKKIQYEGEMAGLIPNPAKGWHIVVVQR